MDEVALPPGWILVSDTCWGCQSKNVMYRAQRKGWVGRGAFVFRVCLSCGHATTKNLTHAAASGLKLTSEDDARY